MADVMKVAAAQGWPPGEETNDVQSSNIETQSGLCLRNAVLTLGNMVGGAMVGITYWFIYLRNSGTRTRTPQ
jgi:formate/nitrite transporter FocA (FNT family)